MNDRQHIESYMRTRTQSIMQYDWYQAGQASGTAPSEWEMVQYGRDTALGWHNHGSLSMAQAIGQGFDAIYRYAYDDIRDTITRQGNLHRTGSATSQTEIHSITLDNLDIDWLDWIARAGLTVNQQQLIVLYALGWTLAEAAEDLALSRSSVYRWFKQALPVLGKDFIT